MKPDPIINRKDDLVTPTKVVKIQEEVMEEGEVRDILEEMGFEVPAPSPRCFFHPKKELEKKTSQAGFNYRRCPLSPRCVLCFAKKEFAEMSMSTIHATLPVLQ